MSESSIGSNCTRAQSTGTVYARTIPTGLYVSHLLFHPGKAADLPGPDQYIAAEFSRHTTRESFWAAYSNNGKQLTWTQLRTRLKQQRQARDREQAAAARAKYANLADHPAFRYMKTNTRRDMTSDRAIARVFRTLEGLQEVCYTLIIIPGVDYGSHLSQYEDEMEDGT